ncbi:MAG: hypothetical protein JWM80_5107 [Cyanobacteria bacterium RYN_339]|nr:hypothetical protein [Cyanobacteria bacterium RYN_339]
MKRFALLALLVAACSTTAPAARRTAPPVQEETPGPLPNIAGEWVVTQGDAPKVVWTIEQNGQLITGTIKLQEDSGLPIAPQPVHGQWTAYGTTWKGRMEAPDGILTYQDGALLFCPTVGSAIGCRVGTLKGASPGPSGRPPLIPG